jgi:hypothetical protein
VIYFNCPHCGRPYEVPDALARLPLVCKQCGQRIVPAEAPKAEAPPVAKPPAPKPVVKPQTAAPPPKPQPAPKPQAVPSPPKPQPAPPEEDDDDVLVTKPDSTPDIDFNVGGPTAASLSDANRTRPAGLSDANRARPTGLSDTTRPRPGELEPTEPEINLDLLPPLPPKPPPRPAPPPEPTAPAEPDSEATLLPFVADLVTFVVLVVVGMLLGEQLVGKQTGVVLSEAASAVKFPPIDLMLWGAPPVVFALTYLLLNSRERTVGAWIRRRRTQS